MRIESAFFSHAGPASQNEDAILPPFQVGDVWWSAIADGVGGHAGGEVASNAVVKNIKSDIENKSSVDVPSLFTSARKRLRELAARDNGLAKMGTTLSIVRLSDQKAEVGHVGDARIYHLRGPGIVGRTKDQTEVQRLIDEGVLTRTRAKRYPRRNVVLSVLSPDKEYDLYQTQFAVEPGDRIILLTDGVYERVLRREIRDLSLRSSSSEELCRNIETEVSSREPRDDYTTICITIQPDM